MKRILLSVLFLLSMNIDLLTSVKKAGGDQSMENHLQLDDSVSDIVNHPAFEGFGERLLPWKNNRSYYDTSLRNVGRLMPYHSNVRPEVVVSALNDMINEV
ncbi:MAG: hypothetical protein R3220_11165, partial [Balneolaceae bacterium]|nr:hypothetical protein [Balneolaceae bacterium]